MKGLTHIGAAEITRAKPYLILEAGVNHEGSLKAAFDMIDARYASTDAYLRDGLGIDEAARARLRANLLE